MDSAPGKEANADDFGLERRLLKAYRRMGIDPRQLEFALAIRKQAGIMCESRHLAMPEGSRGAVHVGQDLQCGAMLPSQTLKVPAGKYVDDVFGCSLKNLVWHGGM